MGYLSTRTITLGSRPSQLARWQTEHVLDLLQKSWPGLDCRMVTLVTQGDRTLNRPLPEIGGKGVFTAELETALHSGEIDLAVHSLKDLPVESAPGLCIGAVSQRADARDVLISANRRALVTLPLGARVGTSSLRREAQIKAMRPDLTILPLRGNVDTRIRKALQGDYEAIILAAAGVERLGLTEHVTEYLSFDVLLPAPGQGALAIQCRADDVELIALLAPIHHAATARAVAAERAFLAGLGGGCSAPVAAYAQANATEIALQGLVASTDGQQVIRVSGNGETPEAVGHSLAQQAIALGAGALL
ncbi:MAG TPA: hydroxymethylbilane synthase [Anaerolineaceae bacterium]